MRISVLPASSSSVSIGTPKAGKLECSDLFGSFIALFSASWNLKWIIYWAPDFIFKTYLYGQVKEFSKVI